MIELDNKIAVVTGATSGIGEAIVNDLIKEKVNVCAVGRNVDKIKNKKYANSKEILEICKVDLEHEEEIEKFSKNMKSKYQHIDILIHCAGIISIANFSKATAKDFDRQFRVNVRAPFLLTKNLLPLIKAKKGQIVFINSTAGLQAKANISQYSATKHALKAIADSLRDEINADGVRVISIFPGRTATPMQESVYNNENKVYDPSKLMQAHDIAEIAISALKLSGTAEITNIILRPLQKE